MMKKVSKILLVSLAMILIATSAFAATDPKTLTGTETASSTGKIYEIGGKIIGGLQGVGSVVAVAILVVLGIKYMLGSAEEKAEYKKTMIPYVVGAILIFAAVNLANMVYTFAKNI